MVEGIIGQPQPFDPAWPRYYPQRGFPSYRHIPGVTPHPFYDPMGHSYGLQEETCASVSLPEEWRKNANYLYGVDLYNFAYWWEAGEMWEGLWKETAGDTRLFFQGLINISVAMLKRHTRKLQGLRRLSLSGRNKLQQVLKNQKGTKGVYMGIDLRNFLDCLDEFFAPFFSSCITEQSFLQVNIRPLISLLF